MSTYPKQVESEEHVRPNGVNEADFETWMLSDSMPALTGVHLRENCLPPCPLHYPSEHSMDDFPLHWRGDRSIFERICEHGIGHPDPDTLDYIADIHGREDADAEGIHGCDGCCYEPVDEPEPSAFSLTQKQVEAVVMAVMRGTGTIEETELTRLTNNFVESTELSRLQLTLLGLVEDEMVNIVDDPDDENGWRVVASQ